MMLDPSPDGTGPNDLLDIDVPLEWVLNPEESRPDAPYDPEPSVRYVPVPRLNYAESMTGTCRRSAGFAQ